MAKSTGLRTEILTTITLLMGAALLLGGVMMLRLTEQSLLVQKVTQLRLMTEIIAQSLADNYGKEHQETAFALNTLKQLPDELMYDGWWLYGSDLSLRASFRSGKGEPISPSRRQQIRYSGEPFESVEFPTLLKVFTTSAASAHYVQPIVQKGRILGLLEMRYSLDDIRYRLLLSQRMVLLYVALYGAVLVSIGYYLLQRNVVKPAKNLLLATQEVGRGNLKTRLPLAGPSEIVQLAEAYNDMVESLQYSRLETQTHIARLQQTNEDLQVAREELIRSEKLASVGHLAAGLAHELGNPLAALIGYLEILRRRIDATEEQDVIVRSLDEAQRIDCLVRELLDFSRPSTQSAGILNVVSELHHCLELLRHQGAFAGRIISDQLPESLPHIKIEQHKLQQVCINLLLNAVQATADDGQIKVIAGVEDKSVWFEISDDGCGIIAEDCKQIFNPFFTTKDPGCGTGLGLAICHRIIEEAGGMIEVNSTEGVGSRFKVTLPIEEAG